MILGTPARLAALGLAATLALGCDEQKTPTATPTDTTSATPAGPGMTPTMAGAQGEAAKTADMVTAKSKEAGATAEAAAKDAGTKAAAAGDTMIAQATKLYDDAKAAVAKADFSGAQKYADQLSAIKDKLPADWQTKVTELEKMIVDGKAKLGAVSLPKIGQ